MSILTSRQTIDHSNLKQSVAFELFKPRFSVKEPRSTHLAVMSNTGSSKESLLSLAPPQIKKSIFELIKRLGDEKSEKQQWKKKYQVKETQVEMLRRQVEKLSEENAKLKNKWKNSCSMIEKVRANFGSKEKVNNELSPSLKKRTKRLRFKKQDAEWVEVSDGEDDDCQAKQVKKGDSNQDVSSENLNANSDRNNIVTSERSHHFPPKTNTQKLKTDSKTSFYTERLPSTEKAKEHRQLSSTKSSSKKAEIAFLKKQIEELTNEIQGEEVKKLSFSEKSQRCEEIKNKFLKHSRVSLNSTEKKDSSIIEQCHSPQNRNNWTQRSINQTLQPVTQESNSNAANYAYKQRQDQKENEECRESKAQHINSFQQQLNFDHNKNLSCDEVQRLQEYDHRNTDHHQFSRKQNSITRANYLYHQVAIKEEAGKQVAARNQTMEGSSSQRIKFDKDPVKVPNKQSMHQSFYDDQLLDLIAEMNP